LYKKNNLAIGHMNCIFILFRGKNSVLWVPSSPVVFPGFVRDCRVFAVFAGFTDNTSGASAYQVGSEMVRFLQELPQNLQQYVPTGKGASRFIRLTWIKIIYLNKKLGWGRCGGQKCICWTSVLALQKKFLGGRHALRHAESQTTNHQGHKKIQKRPW